MSFFLLCVNFTLTAILQRRIDTFHDFDWLHRNVRKVFSQSVAAQRNLGRVHIVALRIELNRFFVRRFGFARLLALRMEWNNVVCLRWRNFRLFRCLHYRRLQSVFLFRRLRHDRLHVRWCWYWRRAGRYHGRDRERRIWLCRSWLRRFRRFDRLEVFILQNIAHRLVVQLAALFRIAQALYPFDRWLEVNSH